MGVDFLASFGALLGAEIENQSPTKTIATIRTLVMEFFPVLERLLDTEGRREATLEAIRLIRTLMKSGVGKDCGVFASDPGDPNHLHIHTVMPVLRIHETRWGRPLRGAGFWVSLNLENIEGWKRFVKSFKKVIVLVGGDNGFLTTVTIRKTGDRWKAIRLGRSHLVEAFKWLNDLYEANDPIRIDGVEIIPHEHLSPFPLCALWLEDSRQFYLVVEISGEPGRKIRALFFPVYGSDSYDGDRRILTPETFARAVEQAPPAY